MRLNPGMVGFVPSSRGGATRRRTACRSCWKGSQNDPCSLLRAGFEAVGREAPAPAGTTGIPVPVPFRVTGLTWPDRKPPEPPSSSFTIDPSTFHPRTDRSFRMPTRPRDDRSSSDPVRRGRDCETGALTPSTRVYT